MYTWYEHNMFEYHTIMIVVECRENNNLFIFIKIQHAAYFGPIVYMYLSVHKSNG